MIYFVFAFTSWLKGALDMIKGNCSQSVVISSRCSLLTGQFAQWRGHGKSYCVGVRRFMFEAWQFLLAHCARLPDTADFVLYELFSIFAYTCAQRSAVEYRHLISYTRSSKYCRLWWQNVEKDGTFPAYSCFSTMDSFRFVEIVSGNGAFQEI